jgi:hypothetical protein
MISLAECASCAKLAPHEIVLGATKCRRHDALLLTYILNLDKKPAAVRDMIVSDLRGFIDLGATVCAADTLLVLRMFLSQYPEACERCDECISLAPPMRREAAQDSAKRGLDCIPISRKSNPSVGSTDVLQ